MRLEAVNDEWFEGVQSMADVFAGVEGPDEDGDAASTTHILYAAGQRNNLTVFEPTLVLTCESGLLLI